MTVPPAIPARPSLGRRLVAMTLALGVGACGDEVSTLAPRDHIASTPTQLALLVGDSAAVRVVSLASGWRRTGARITFAVSTPAVLTVRTASDSTALVVAVQDSISRVLIARGALLVLTAEAPGVRPDAAVGVFDEQALEAGQDRPGRYHVTVSKAGYRVWQQAGIEPEDGCTAIRTVPLLARLVRE